MARTTRSRAITARSAVSSTKRVAPPVSSPRDLCVHLIGPYARANSGTSEVPLGPCLGGIHKLLSLRPCGRFFDVKTD